MAQQKLEDKQSTVLSEFTENSGYTGDDVDDKGKGLGRMVKDTEVFLKFGVLFFGVIGVFMLTLANSIADVLPWILGIAALVFGLAYILRDKTPTKRYNVGAAAVICCAILLLRSELAIIVCSIMFGFLILFTAAVQLRNMYISIRLADGKWYFILVDVVVSVVLGFMTLFFPLDAAMPLIQFIGIILVIECGMHYILTFLAFLSAHTGMGRSFKRFFTSIFILAAVAALVIFIISRLSGAFGTGSGNGIGLDGGSGEQYSSSIPLNSVTISVSENSIKYNNKEYSSVSDEEFVTALASIKTEGNITVTLIDSAAKKSTFDEVKAKLDSMQITYVLVQ